jgi:broad specificity phosphatase PhoE
MTELYVVRHGETEWSANGRHTSVTDLPLTDHGEEQARALIGHLDPKDFALVLSSPRLRARHTAELAGFTGEHEPQLDEDLAEWSYGDYEGRTSAEISEEVPGWTIWTHPVPHGESADQVSARLDRVVARVQDSGVERAICFGHGHALRALAMRWLRFDLRLGLHFPLDTSTVSVLGEEKGEPALERWNARP